MFGSPLRGLTNPAPPAASGPTGPRPDPGGPLAPDLHAALRRAYGEVKIRLVGQLYGYDIEYGLEGPRTRFHSPGELYCFNCPFCGDRRHRGWVSYAYGQPDPVTGRPMRSLVNCWNERCFDEHRRRFDFELQLLGFMPVPGGPFPRPDETRGHQVERRAPAMPGLILPLDELPATHAACRYVSQRGFDPGYLAREFGVGYCASADDFYAPAANRLVVPVRMNHRLAGWQARRIDGREKFKYYTMPGLETGRTIYNWDRLQECDVIVLVEGVADVWAIGSCAGALFGKTLKAGQLQLLQAFAPRQPDILLLLDRDAAGEAERARGQMEPLFPGRVRIVRLPERVERVDCRTWPVGKIDAGVLTTEALERILVAALEEEA